MPSTSSLPRNISGVVIYRLPGRDYFESTLCVNWHFHGHDVLLIDRVGHVRSHLSCESLFRPWTGVAERFRVDQDCADLSPDTGVFYNLLGCLGMARALLEITAETCGISKAGEIDLCIAERGAAATVLKEGYTTQTCKRTEWEAITNPFSVSLS